MNFEKVIDEFIKEYLPQCPHGSREEIVKVLEDTVDILYRHKDATPEELVAIMIQDCTDDLTRILVEYPTPGIVSSLKVDNIQANIHGGAMRPNGSELSEEALFDIASISKLYTEIIAYKLIHEGRFALKDKIASLDSRFENVGELTVEDVLQFCASFKTDGRLEDANSKEEALKKLFSMQVVQRGEQYNYNDMGLMLMKEVMEAVTGKTYEELFEEYIIEPYRLSNTHIVVPEDKKHLVTGTPNLDGSVNDLKADVLGGYSGHAGVRVTNQDLLTLLESVAKDSTLIDHLYDPNHLLSKRSDKMGNAYVNPQSVAMADGTIVSGREKSYFGRLAPRDSMAVQGSTRVIGRVSNANGIIISSTALTNIASMTEEEMRALIEKANREILAKDPNAKVIDPESLIKTRQYEGKIYQMHDPRRLMNEDKTIGSVLYRYDNEVVLKLLLLNKILKEYEHYNESIHVDIPIQR